MDDEELAVRVGGIVLLVLIVATALVLLLQGKHLVPGMRLHVEITRIGALQPGAPLRIASLELGTVETIGLEARPGGPVALLGVWVDRRHAWLLHGTTDFFLSQQGLLGETYLEAAERPGPPGPPLADGATVRAVAPPPIDTLLATSYQNLQAATALFRDGMPEVATLRLALHALDATLASLEPGTAERAAAWVAGQRLAGEVRALAGSAPAGSEDVRGDAAALGRSVAASVPGLAERAARLADVIRPLAARGDDPRLARVLAALDRAQPILAGVERARAQTEALAALVASGRGTIGALLQDVELADDLKEQSKRMKREPWRALGHP